MNKLRLAIGVTLIGMPIAAATVSIAASGGLLLVAQVYGTAATLFGCVLGGFYVLNSGFKD